MGYIKYIFFLFLILLIGCKEDSNTPIKNKLWQATELNNNGEKDKAMTKLLEASSHINNSTPMSDKINIYTQLGALYYEDHKIKDAQKYFNKAVELAEEEDSLKQHPELLWNLTLTVYDNDSLKNILSLCRDYSDLDRLRFQFLAIRSRIALSKIYSIDGNYNLAKCILDSIDTSSLKNLGLYTDFIIQQAIINITDNKIDEGIEILNNLSNESLSVDGKRERVYLLHLAYKGKNDFQKALLYRDSLAIYNDSIYSLMTSDNLKNVASTFNNKLEKEKSNLRLSIIVGSIVVLFLLIIILLINKSRNLKSKQVSLSEQISNLNLKLSALQIEDVEYPQDKTEVIISKFKLQKELFFALPFSKLISQANLEQNAEDIPKERRKEIMEAIISQFSETSNNLKDEFPSLSSDDLLLCIMSYLGLNKEIIALLLKSSEDAIRQRKSRLKKKVTSEVFDFFFYK